MQSQPEVKTQFKEQPYRWVIVAVFCILTFVHAMVYILVPPIGYTLGVVYGVESKIINIIPMFNTIMFAVGNFPANYFLDQHGTRVGLNIGCGLFLAGTAIQLFINVNFDVFIFGAAIVGLAQAFIYNCTGKVPTYWFFKQNRNIMVTIFALLNNVGAIIGFIIPSQIVSQTAFGDAGKQQVFNLFLIAFCLTAFSCILIFIFMRYKPDTPPSLGGQVDRIPFRQSLQMIFKNRNFLLLTLGFVFYFSPVSALTGLLSYLMIPFGFTNTQISYFGVELCLSGILGAAIVSVIVSKTLQYAWVTKIVALTGVLLTVLLYLSVLYFPTYPAIMTILFFLGLFITPLYPLAIDFGCEMAFPIGQAQVQGFFSVSGSIVSFCLMLAVEYTIGFGTAEKSAKIFLIFLIFGIVGGIFYWLTANDLRRRNLQEEHSKKASEGLSSNQKISQSFVPLSVVQPRSDKQLNEINPQNNKS